MRYYLHYVGNGLYPEGEFIKESKKYGVNRCFPLRIIKNLKWGERILLATFQKDANSEVLKGGTANVFGYFVVNGINIVASEHYKEQLKLSFKEGTTVDHPMEEVYRRCGSYIITNRYYIMETIPEVVEKIKTISDRMKEPVKVFVTGKFYDYERTITPISFSRSVVRVEGDMNLGSEATLTHVGFLSTYNKRSYITKKALAELVARG
jgi:hypothetical protein